MSEIGSGLYVKALLPAKITLKLSRLQPSPLALMRICAAQFMNLSSAGVLGQKSTLTVSVISFGITNGKVPDGEYVEVHDQN